MAAIHKRVIGQYEASGNSPNLQERDKVIEIGHVLLKDIQQQTNQSKSNKSSRASKEVTKQTAEDDRTSAEPIQNNRKMFRNFKLRYRPILPRQVKVIGTFALITSVTEVHRPNLKKEEPLIYMVNVEINEYNVMTKVEVSMDFPSQYFSYEGESVKLTKDKRKVSNSSGEEYSLQEFQPPALDDMTSDSDEEHHAKDEATSKKRCLRQRNTVRLQDYDFSTSDNWSSSDNENDEFVIKKPRKSVVHGRNQINHVKYGEAQQINEHIILSSGIKDDAAGLNDSNTTMFMKTNIHHGANSAVGYCKENNADKKNKTRAKIEAISESKNFEAHIDPTSKPFVVAQQPVNGNRSVKREMLPRKEDVGFGERLLQEAGGKSHVTGVYKRQVQTTATLKKRGKSKEITPRSTSPNFVKDSQTTDDVVDSVNGGQDQSRKTKRKKRKISKGKENYMTNHTDKQKGNGSEDSANDDETQLRLAMEFPRHNWLVKHLIKEKQSKENDEAETTGPATKSDKNAQNKEKESLVNSLCQPDVFKLPQSSSSDNAATNYTDLATTITPSPTLPTCAITEGQHNVVGIVKPFQHSGQPTFDVLSLSSYSKKTWKENPIEPTVSTIVEKSRALEHKGSSSAENLIKEVLDYSTKAIPNLKIQRCFSLAVAHADSNKPLDLTSKIKSAEEAFALDLSKKATLPTIKVNGEAESAAKKEKKINNESNTTYSSENSSKALLSTKTFLEEGRSKAGNESTKPPESFVSSESKGLDKPKYTETVQKETVLTATNRNQLHTFVKKTDSLVHLSPVSTQQPPIKTLPIHSTSHSHLTMPFEAQRPSSGSSASLSVDKTFKSSSINENNLIEQKRNGIVCKKEQTPEVLSLLKRNVVTAKDQNKKPAQNANCEIIDVDALDDKLPDIKPRYKLKTPVTRKSASFPWQNIPQAQNLDKSRRLSNPETTMLSHFSQWGANGSHGFSSSPSLISPDKNGQPKTVTSHVQENKELFDQHKGLRNGRDRIVMLEHRKPSAFATSPGNGTSFYPGGLYDPILHPFEKQSNAISSTQPNKIRDRRSSQSLYLTMRQPPSGRTKLQEVLHHSQHPSEFRLPIKPVTHLPYHAPRSRATPSTHHAESTYPGKLLAPSVADQPYSRGVMNRLTPPSIKPLLPRPTVVRAPPGGVSINSTPISALATNTDRLLPNMFPVTSQRQLNHPVPIINKNQISHPLRNYSQNKADVLAAEVKAKKMELENKIRNLSEIEKRIQTDVLYSQMRTPEEHTKGIPLQHPGVKRKLKDPYLPKRMLSPIGTPFYSPFKLQEQSRMYYDKVARVDRPAMSNPLVDAREISKEWCVGCKNKAYFVCSGCRGVWYCSKQCQFHDWTRHSKTCV
ncbi:uncharacterized protein LOC143468895 isoform X2 [Clavelina lepadiformis]|uniref:uncharacterized protein LOC143468895 isoform X2 n=1 Tax=Clavelina lepadiformis TaxID=159417 RepID=UPI0040411297